MTLFLTSAYLAIRARANSLVRLENEEIDALLQGKNLTLNFKRALTDCPRPEASG